jgi:alkanesulfonate monooxygenase SsuD/methylene tetrahydromethanopterin reductase-like flavin-dependent oxidoreductase (luciferase family)
MAKMIASVDVISKGRFVFGIGSGGQPEEHLAYGIPFPNIDERFRRLEETVKALKRLISRRELFNGKSYHISGRALKQRHFKSRHVPIIVGGGGYRNISVAALWADGWNIFNPSVEEFSKQHQEFKNYCVNHGKSWRSKHVSVAVTCLLEHDSEKARNKFRQMYPRNRHYESHQLPLYVGSISGLASFLSRYVDIGANEIIIDLPDARRLDLIEDLGELVIPSILG